jgi:hypothetical protein
MAVDHSRSLFAIRFEVLAGQHSMIVDHSNRVRRFVVVVGLV